MEEVMCPVCREKTKELIPAFLYETNEQRFACSVCKGTFKKEELVSATELPAELAPNFNHVMLDLETLSTGKDAAILSIGAVKFCLETFALGEEFYRVIRLGSCIAANLSIDASTIEWWMTQSDEARAIFNYPRLEEFIDGRVFDTAAVRMPLSIALNHFSRFVKPHDHIQADSCIWGNGATFDNVILRNAYEACGMSYPVSYKNDLCYRTIRRLFQGLVEEENKKELEGLIGIRHNALDDAREQVKKLIATWKAVNAR